MTAGVVVLLVLAGLSEAAGRVLPVVAGRSGATRTGTAGLLLTGTVIDGVMIALWPVLASVLAGADTMVWSASLVAPLLLAAVLAFPLLGPALHGLLVVGVGAGLTGALATSAGIGWWQAAGWVALAGVGLAAAVTGVRRLVISLHRGRSHG
ncbi:hypothetical protein OWR29_04025 [Actinoplanes sp. Pm04-4]|uniref:Integral membrane protein n=1 Tax=Paractinoplanes pyxinae TaxID=2997416 RepID=A0ABT4ASC7_9ACTN|nr:hypothetical protein [Actinoplanes pyxinae]MCY1137154.1 hypothetical protein [Actinoplanes pyxinae]